MARGRWWKRSRQLKEETSILESQYPHYMPDSVDMLVLPNLKSPRLRVDLGAITLVTQMSVDETKLQRLLDVAARWTGYISVAVYVKPETLAPGSAYIEDAVRQLDEYREDNSHELRMVRFHLVVDERGAQASHYPHNYLRNIAMDNAPTDLVFLTDIDFIPSIGSHDYLKGHFEKSSLLQGDLDLLVLPAFERILAPGESELTVTVDNLPPTKKDLLQMMEEEPGQYTQFHHFFDEGHGPTNYSHWYNATEPYEIKYALNYEPYYVVRKSSELPPLWEHFSGFGRNKVTWVEEMALAGYNFNVAPEPFLIHINHDYNKQDARSVRPFVIDEYATRFQPYLNKTYGNAFWDNEILYEWHLGQKRNYVKKVFRFCTEDSVHLEGSEKNLTFGYQCKGKAYNTFTRAMQDYAADIPGPIGRRSFPMKENQTVLVMGDSHTQQMIKTFVCQFKERVVEYANKVGSGSSHSDAFTVYFENGSTLISLTNPPEVYSKQWSLLIEGVIGRKMETLDAVVVGKFTSYSESTGTDFHKHMVKASRGLKGVDFAKVPAPTLQDFAAVYSGPLVYVSEFAITGDAELDESIKTMEAAKPARTNIDVVDGRKYIKLLGFECGSDDINTVEKCREPTDPPKKSTRPSNEMHRCTGAKGGHPDLIAWEVTEVLHKLH